MMRTRLLWFTLGFASTSAVMTHFVFKDLWIDRKGIFFQVILYKFKHICIWIVLIYINFFFLILFFGCSWMKNLILWTPEFRIWNPFFLMNTLHSKYGFLLQYVMIFYFFLSFSFWQGLIFKLESKIIITND